LAIKKNGAAQEASLGARKKLADKALSPADRQKKTIHYISVAKNGYQTLFWRSGATLARGLLC
jgi:hypothetical protein